MAEYLKTATEVIAEFRAGQRTVRDYVETLLARVAAVEPNVLAFEALEPDAIRREADKRDALGARGLLHGIPFTAKDIIDTATLPTQYGSPIYRDVRPVTDAACVAASIGAGGILMGKSVTTEFANVTPGKTRNPFDPMRTPGGSSSGSAAAVGAGMTPLALGTQTTSSTIRPASYCGVYGYTSSFGDLSLSGVRQAAWSLDRLGLFARSVDDIHLFRAALRGTAFQELEPRGVAGLRVGFCRTHLWEHVEPSTQAAFEAAAGRLSRAGARVVDLALPPEFARLQEAHRWISSYEFTRNFAFEITHHFERISAALRDGRIADGLECPSERYDEAKRAAATARAAFGEISADYDILLTPGAAGEAPDAATTGNYAFCAMWTLLHVPAISIPAFHGPNGLPVGLQIVGRQDEDEALLRDARAVATALGARVGV